MEDSSFEKSAQRGRERRSEPAAKLSDAVVPPHTDCTRIYHHPPPATCSIGADPVRKWSDCHSTNGDAPAEKYVSSVATLCHGEGVREKTPPSLHSNEDPVERPTHIIANIPGSAVSAAAASGAPITAAAKIEGDGGTSISSYSNSSNSSTSNSTSGKSSNSDGTGTSDTGPTSSNTGSNSNDSSCSSSHGSSLPLAAASSSFFEDCAGVGPPTVAVGISVKGTAGEYSRAGMANSEEVSTAAADASASTAAAAKESRLAPQLQSLSDFSRSVGISEFVVCGGDQKKPSAVRDPAKAGVDTNEGQPTATASNTSLPYSPPSPPTFALRGSLKTLYEDFQVYEDSFFPCTCNAEEKTCTLCGTRSGTSDDKAVSGGCRRSNRSTIKRRETVNNSYSVEGGRAARPGAVHPCEFGCWCRAFGGGQPLRLPYLVLPGDVMQQKQRQLLRESGAAYISVTFRYNDGRLPCFQGAFHSIRSSHESNQEASSKGNSSFCASSDAGARTSSCETISHVQNRKSANSAEGFGGSHNRFSCPASSTDGGSLGGNGGKESLLESKLRQVHVGARGSSKRRKTPGDNAALAPARSGQAAAEGMVKPAEESSKGFPFSAAEIQNVEAFVRYLAAASAVYTRSVTAEETPQLATELRQQEDACFTLKRGSIQQQRERKPARQQPPCSHEEGLRTDVDSSTGFEGTEGETDRYLKGEKASLVGRLKSDADIQSSQGSCCVATPKVNGAGFTEDWEAVAERAAAEAEAAAAAEAAGIAVRRSSNPTSSRKTCCSFPSVSLQDENPFFAGIKLLAVESEAAALGQKSRQDEQLGKRQLRKRKAQQERRLPREGRDAAASSSMQRRLEPQAGTAEDRPPQKRQQRVEQTMKCMDPPTLWVLGNWASCVCRLMLEADAAANLGLPGAVYIQHEGAWGATQLASPSSSFYSSSSLSFSSSSSPFSCAFLPSRPPSCDAGTTPENFGEDTQNKYVAPSAVGAAAAAVGSDADGAGSMSSKDLAAAVAACVDKTAPSLKDLQKTVRKSMHKCIQQVLPFFTADTLPVSAFLREDGQSRKDCEGLFQRKGLHETGKEKPQQQHEPHTAENRGRSAEVHEVAMLSRAGEENLLRKEMQVTEGERVPLDQVQKTRWGLLRVQAPPGALYRLSQAVSAAIGRPEGRAAASPAAADVNEGGSCEKLESNDRGRSARRRESMIPVLSTRRVAVSVAPLRGRADEEKLALFVSKYFVSIAACFAQQCRVLEQLLDLLRQRLLELQGKVVGLNQRQRQLPRQHLYGEEEAEEREEGQSGDEERLRNRLAHCEQWINLISAAVAALSDKEQQPQLPLLRLTPTPACMHYLFPRANDLHRSLQLRQFLLTGCDSCSDLLRFSDSASAAAGEGGGKAAADKSSALSASLYSAMGTREGLQDSIAGAIAKFLPSAPRQGGHAAPYLHFVLLKVNRDTAAAMRLLEQQLRHGQRIRHSSSPWAAGSGRGNGTTTVNSTVSLASAGTKDKRGVTVQRCSAFKVSAEALLEACYLGQQQRQHFKQQVQPFPLQQLKQQQQQQQRVPGQVELQLEGVLDGSHGASDAPEGEQLPFVFVAPLGYYSEPQWLGGLRGNFFQVVIRNLRPAAADVSGQGAVAPAAAPEAASFLGASAAGRRELFGNASEAAGAAAANDGVLTNRDFVADDTDSFVDGTVGIEGLCAAASGISSASAGAAAQETSAVQHASSAYLWAGSLATSTFPEPAAGEAERLLDLIPPATPQAEESRYPKPRRYVELTESSMKFADLSECGEKVQQLWAAVARSMRSLSTTGFLNYYGLQRFGTHEVRTYEVGAALLRRDWLAAVAGILGGRALTRREGAAGDAAVTGFFPAQATAGAEGSCGSTQEARTRGMMNRDNWDGLPLVSDRQPCTPASGASPWDVLLQRGPAAALTKLAKHQYVERSLLSALLSQSSRQAQAPHIHPNINRRSTPPPFLPASTHCQLPSSSSLDPASLVSTTSAITSNAASPVGKNALSLNLSSAKGPCSSSCAYSYAANAGGHEEFTHASSPSLPARKNSSIKTTITKRCGKEQKNLERKQPLQLPVTKSHIQDDRQHQRSDDLHAAMPCIFEKSDLRNARAKLTSSLKSARTLRLRGGLAADTSAASGTAAKEVRSHVSYKGGHTERGASPSSAACFRALQTVPTASLQLYIHAAQSVLFNFACSWRWSKYGPQVRIGEFVRERAVYEERSPESSFDDEKNVYDSVDASHAEQNRQEKTNTGLCAPVCLNNVKWDLCLNPCLTKETSHNFTRAGGEGSLKGLFRGGSPGKSVGSAAVPRNGSSTEKIEALASVGENGQNRFENTKKTPHNVTGIRVIQTEEEAQKASVHDVVLPLAGTDVEYPNDLLQMYQKLSREILGVPFAAFEQFNAAANDRGPVGRQLKRKRAYAPSHPASGRERKLPVQREFSECSADSSSVERHSKSADSSGRNECRCGHCRGNRDAGDNLRESHEAQARKILVSASVLRCHAEQDLREVRCAVRQLSNSPEKDITRRAGAEENFDLRSLGVICRGGFRSLVVRPQCCSWQLLRIGDNPDELPKPVLLSDVDLLLQWRRDAARKVPFQEATFLETRTMLQKHSQRTRLPLHQLETEHLQRELRQADQNCEAGRRDYRIAWDEKLASHLLRCVPAKNKKEGKTFVGAAVLQHSDVRRVSERGGEAQGTSLTTSVHRKPLVASSVGYDKSGSSLVEEVTSDEHRAVFEKMQRTDLVVRGERSNFCLLLRLWLPAGCYFTMALREIMRANAPDEDGAAFAGARLRYISAD